MVRGAMVRGETSSEFGVRWLVGFMVFVEFGGQEHELVKGC